MQVVASDPRRCSQAELEVILIPRLLLAQSGAPLCDKRTRTTTITLQNDPNEPVRRHSDSQHRKAYVHTKTNAIHPTGAYSTEGARVVAADTVVPTT